MYIYMGFPGDVNSKPACQCRHKRHRVSPRVRKIPWRRAWRSTPVFLSGEEEPGVLHTVHRVEKNQTQLK